MSKCQNCGMEFKIDVIIPNELWSQITPSKSNRKSGLLCGKCIFEKLENIMDYSAFKLEPITTNIQIDNFIKNYVEKNYKNKFKVYFIKRGDAFDKINPNAYDNNSYSAGHIHHKNAEIWVGYGYKTAENKLLAFFHELAHITAKTTLNKNLTKYEYEREMWKYGLKLAKKENIRFSFSTLKYAINCLNTYK